MDVSRWLVLCQDVYYNATEIGHDEQDHHHMPTTSLRALLQLRMLVGFLGERPQYGWWSSTYLTVANHHALTPAFGARWSIEQYRGVVEAARRVHDARVPADAQHLFHVSETIEHELFTLMTGTAPAVTPPTSTGTALEMLRTIADPLVIPVDGPTAVGPAAELLEGRIVPALAAQYAAAFAHGGRSFPYLTLERRRRWR
jgi:hypothetical protein